MDNISNKNCTPQKLPIITSLTPILVAEMCCYGDSVRLLHNMW